MIKDEPQIVTEKINNWFWNQNEFEEADEKILSQGIKQTDHNLDTFKIRISPDIFDGLT